MSGNMRNNGGAGFVAGCQFLITGTTLDPRGRVLQCPGKLSDQFLWQRSAALELIEVRLRDNRLCRPCDAELLLRG